jgi:ribosomal protein S27AE
MVDEQPDYATWLTKAQVADALDVSTKTVEKFARRGDITQGFRRNLLTGVLQAVYQPADVARMPRLPGRARRLAPVSVRLTLDAERRFHENQGLRFVCRRRTKALIKRGVLVRQPCERCGAEKVHAHHDDYTNPARVRWLCHCCHHQLHYEQRHAADASRRRVLPRGTPDSVGAVGVSDLSKGRAS